MNVKDETLENTKKWLGILLEKAPDAYFLSDVKGRFIDANKAAEEIIGYEKKELVGKLMIGKNILPKDQIPKVIKRLAQHALGKSVKAEELELLRKDGKRRSIEVTGNILRLKDKILVLGIVRDITERKRIENELKRKNEALEKFRKMIVGRELKMIELKNKIKKLEEQLEKNNS